MKTVLIRALSVVPILLILTTGACSATKTVTVALTQPATTVTSPAFTTTLPAVTVTLPKGVTTIAAITVTETAVINTVPAVTVLPAIAYGPSGFLPDKPSNITQHASIMTALKGDCLTCHGPQAVNQAPLSPYWKASAWNSTAYTGFYYVVAGSLPDHTGRTADQCLTCHAATS